MARPKSLDNGFTEWIKNEYPVEETKKKRSELSQGSHRKFQKGEKVNRVTERRGQILRAKRWVLEFLIQSSATSEAQFPEKRLELRVERVNEGPGEY